ncbi:MAG: hypothetical protein ACI855_004482, partial [Myxococcota bacterium]
VEDSTTTVGSSDTISVGVCGDISQLLSGQ